MAFKFGASSSRVLHSVDRRWDRILRLALSISRIDFGIASDGGYRTQKEQFSLFMRRKSGMDGTRLVSKHQLGLAVDVFAYVDGKANYDADNMTHIASAILQAASHFRVELKWGGLFLGHTDMPHFEMVE